MNEGYLTLFRWRTVPLRFHWTVPLGAFLLGGMRFDPMFWLGFVVLVLAHEFGHALVIRSMGLRVLAIDVHGAGGLCRWAGTVTPIQRATIAWGGVWAQLALLVVVQLVTLAHGIPVSRWGQTLDEVFVDRNLWLVALNLLPFAPLDGAQAWALPGLLYKRLRERRRARHGRSERTGPRVSAKGESPRGDATADEVHPEVDRLLGRIPGLRTTDTPKDAAHPGDGRDKPN